MQDTTDLKKLDDAEFFAERQHIRERLALLPEHHVERASLATRFEQTTDELTRRAASAWGTST